MVPLLVTVFHPNEVQVFAGEEEGDTTMRERGDLEEDLRAEEARAEVEQEQEFQGEEEDIGEPGRGLTEQDKKLIKELHTKMGHPAQGDFARMLRLARARPEVWKGRKSSSAMFASDINDPNPRGHQYHLPV